MKLIYFLLATSCLAILANASLTLISPVEAACSQATAGAETTPLPNDFCITNGTDSSGKVTTPLADPNKAYGLLGKTISVILTIIIIAGAVTCLIYLIIGTIQWTTARAGAGAAQGRTTMTFAIIGLILLALSYLFIVYYNAILPMKTTGPSDCSSQVNGAC